MSRPQKPAALSSGRSVAAALVLQGGRRHARNSKFGSKFSNVTVPSLASYEHGLLTALTHLCKPASGHGNPNPDPYLWSS